MLTGGGGFEVWGFWGFGRKGGGGEEGGKVTVGAKGDAECHELWLWLWFEEMEMDGWSVCGVRRMTYVVGL